MYSYLNFGFLRVLGSEFLYLRRTVSRLKSYAGWGDDTECKKFIILIYVLIFANYWRI